MSQLLSIANSTALLSTALLSTALLMNCQVIPGFGKDFFRRVLVADLGTTYTRISAAATPFAITPLPFIKYTNACFFKSVAWALQMLKEYPATSLTTIRPDLAAFADPSGAGLMKEMCRRIPREFNEEQDGVPYNDWCATEHDIIHIAQELNICITILKETQIFIYNGTPINGTPINGTPINGTPVYSLNGPPNGALNGPQISGLNGSPINIRLMLHGGHYTYPLFQLGDFEWVVARAKAAKIPYFTLPELTNPELSEQLSLATIAALAPFPFDGNDPQQLCVTMVGIDAIVQGDAALAYELSMMTN